MKTFKQLIESLNEAWPKLSDAKGFTGKGSDGKQTGNRHNIETKDGVTKVTRKYDPKTGESDEPKQASSGEAPVKRGRGRPPGKYGSYKKKVKESIEIIESLETEEEIEEFIDSLDEESFIELHDFLEEVDLEEAYDSDGFHKSVNKGIFQSSRHGSKDRHYLHDTENKSGDGHGHQLVTFAKKGHAAAAAKKHGGKLEQTKFGSYRVYKETNEEVEQIDELSKTKLKAYVDKAVDRTAAHAYIAGGGTGQTDKATTKKEFATAVKRIQGVRKATTRLAKEEVETIDELSKSTLTRYANTAVDRARSATATVAGSDDKDEIQKKSALAQKRLVGHKKAVAKLAKEDVEQIEEISNKTKLSYLNVASARAGGARAMADLHRDAGDEENAKRYDDKAAKREKGIARAVAPVKKHFGMKEETQIDESVQHIADFISNNKE